MFTLSSKRRFRRFFDVACTNGELRLYVRVTLQCKLLAMSEPNDKYPLTSLHMFLEEASKEFKRFRFQAKINLIGSIVLLLLVSRFAFFFFVNFGPPPFERTGFEAGFRPPPFFHPDTFLIIAALVAVTWSLYVWIKQRQFVSRWGQRFEKLDALEKRLLPDEKS